MYSEIIGQVLLNVAQILLDRADVFAHRLWRRGGSATRRGPRCGDRLLLTQRTHLTLKIFYLRFEFVYLALELLDLRAIRAGCTHTSRT